jgi:zinc protease
MRLKLVPFLLLLLTAAGLKAQDPYALTATFPIDSAIRTGTLPNGMKYFIRRNTKPANRAELRLAVNVGATMESDNQQGLAHFVEHMCFNGTKNFKKSELVDYLESIGTKFGPHLNAYTSFDETVYMLQVPTDSTEYVTKGLQILEDWAHNVSFDADEIDKERGVVTEEWRLGLGADERMRAKYFPIILKDSRYAVRLPIGKPEILKNAPYDTLRSFYKTWYRPELMSVMAVGDFDPAEMEKRIIEQFSKIPATKNGLPVQKWDMPDNAEPLAAVVSDKENPYTQIQIIYKHPHADVNTVADYRQGLVNSLFENMINARMEELTQKPNPPFVYGGCGYGDFLRPKDAYYGFAVVAEDGIQRGIETIIEENNRVRQYGFTQTELDRAKQELLRGYEKSYAEREKTESRSYIGEYVRHFLEHEPIPGIAFEYEIAKRYIPGITLQEVNVLPSKWITDGKNMVATVTAPDKEGLVLPSADEVIAIIKNATKKPILAYVDEVTEGPLMATKPAAGKVTAQKEIKEVGATEFTLSNGVKAVLKTTDFKNDEILFSSTGWGGVSLFGEADNQSADFSNAVVMQGGVADISKIKLDKMLKGKIVNVWPVVGNYTEGFSGSCSPTDLETAMQLIYLYATQPRKDAGAFVAMMDQQKALVANRSSDPEQVFRDTVSVVMASHHPRMKPLSIEELNKVNLDRSYDIYKQLFSNFNGHTFVFVGNVDAATFKTLAEQYLGALPSKGKAPEWKDLGIKAPKGKLEKVVKKGVEPKSSVQLRTHGKFEWTLKNRIEFDALLGVLRIKLRENLREDKGGVYGVGAYGGPVKIPNTTYSITIAFGCAPENVDTLINNTLLEIEKLKANGPEAKDLVKVKETMKREREINLKENRFWQGVISSYMQNNEKWSDFATYDKIVEGIDAETIKKLANKYFTMENFARFVLMPEN